jgi:uncharacterized protein (TIGR02145 family)
MKKIFFLMLAFLIGSTASLNAQVRIGGTEDPHRSAVLDLNADDDANEGNFGLILPRVSLTSVKQQLNAADPANGAIVWNTNDDFYLGKGVYVWGDTVWVPVQRTLFSNATLNPITTVPVVTVLSNPALGLGVTFQVPTFFQDMGNTARFLWEVKANGEPEYAPEGTLSGSRREVMFVPYDNNERTYSARVKAISNNGTSDSEWTEWVESNPGQYQGWYRITGATGYDILASGQSNPLNGRDRSQMSLTGNTYTVETLAGIGEATYQWSIVSDGTGGLASLAGGVTSEMVELRFEEDILTKGSLSGHPDVAETIVLQCSVDDDRGTYILQRKITVGDRDECSPAAGLLDAEGNRYPVSKFGGVCWMTQNLHSTYTWQGNQKQEIPQDRNEFNDPNAVAYYYPGANDEAPTSYGLLYTWGAANIGTLTTEAVNAYPSKVSERQGICPDGWVLPSDYDFNRLEEEIATQPSLYSTHNTQFAWNSMYESMTGWRPGTGNGVPDYWGRQMKSPTAVTTANSNGFSKTDGTGFNALLVGLLVNGVAGVYGTDTGFWSSSSSSSTVAWFRYLNSGSSGAYRITYNKYALFSVRCKKLE